MAQEPCCNAKVREGLMANNAAITSVYFDLSNIQSFERNKPVGGAKTGQKIEVYYDKVMKNGEVRNVKRNSFVSHDYCPFCGKKYA